MAQPNSPDAIVSTPAVEGQPYDATADGDVGQWRKLPSGPVSAETWALTGNDWPDSPPWRQC